MSWVSYLPDHPFPIQNLPWGVYSKGAGAKHCCSTIGDYIVDLHALATAGAFVDAKVTAALQKGELNDFMGLGYAHWKSVRDVLIAKLTKGDAGSMESDAALRGKVLIPTTDATMHLPCTIGDYTDFYASKEHATNLGKLFRPGQPALFDNWLTIPIGYHGRSSTIVVSGTDFHRPNGQKRPVATEPPIVGPCMALDIELEMAAYVGKGCAMGDSISVHEARENIFGFSLFNDWSARDIQRYEYVPLGPFAGKNFASTVSPWIINPFALKPFEVEAPAHDPATLDYLTEKKGGNYDVDLTVTYKTKEGESKVVSNTNYKYMYWSANQMLAHHSLNGCGMRPGDVMASGTISGPTAGSYGSLLEITWQGKEAMVFPSGAERKMLQDGDSIALNGECRGDGYCIGFGDCTSKILPAKPVKI